MRVRMRACTYICVCVCVFKFSTQVLNKSKTLKANILIIIIQNKFGARLKGLSQTNIDFALTDKTFLHVRFRNISHFIFYL